MLNIVIFASGGGSNAEQIVIQSLKNTKYSVAAIFSNKPNAMVLEKAKKYKIPTLVFSKLDFESVYFLQTLQKYNPDFIILAGFLWKIPAYLVQTFPNRIINIHPALLPKYGGKGMYGMHVHQAVFDNKEIESGITIHYVNDEYDQGKFIFQRKITISDCESAEAIAQKVLKLEHEYFPKVIENLTI
jgi:phosphoribosylglycinamide formyltransferase-1